MTEALFFRLLNETIDEKGQALAAKIADVNTGDNPTGTFSVEDEAFEQIPSSPFAYWVSASIRALFSSFPRFDSQDYVATKGLATTDDFQFLRLWWETQSDGWINFAKGGAYSPFFSDIHLIVDWRGNGQKLKDYLDIKISGKSGTNQWSRWINGVSFYYRRGLTWSQRTQKGLNLRALPQGCVFANKGPVIFSPDDSKETLMYLLGLTNSTIFRLLVNFQTSFGAYDVGIIQKTPIPIYPHRHLGQLSHNAHDLQREKFIHDETTHVFQLPALVAWRGDSLSAANMTLEELAEQRLQSLAEVQAKIDEIVFDLYGLNETDRQAVLEQSTAPISSSDEEANSMVDSEDGDEDEEEGSVEGLVDRAQNLLMWAVGVAFGRWDVRKALDLSLIPPLPQPFDPLPSCAPGALMAADGLPLEKDQIPENYPLSIAWDGILVDDPAQENTPNSLDIVARVRQVLTLLWSNRAHRIEDELCQILGVQNLRDYFRHPTKGFFAFHIKRYSKSRRKAPIYWFLQSEKKNTGLWLYYPRIVEDTLFIAEDLLHKKLRLEQNRLDEFKQELGALNGAERKKHERKIEQQARHSEEISVFYNSIRRLANLKLPPDHNDGVLISIAPLHELVPWKEARAMWQKLQQGEFAWGGMSEQLRKRGLIAGKE